MKCVLLLLVSATAAAEPLQLVVVPQGARAAVAPDEKACETADAPHQLRTKTAKIGGHEVEILHECGGIPADASLSVQGEDGWATTFAGAIADYSHMGHPPWSLQLVSETLTLGRFGDGEAAIVATLVHSEGDVAAKSKSLFADVTVCRADGPVQCAHISYRCPAKGCQVPTFDQGMLVTTEQRTYAPPYVP
jgi:hypothetical protein